METGTQRASVGDWVQFTLGRAEAGASERAESAMVSVRSGFMDNLQGWATLPHGRGQGAFRE
ncbi:hypothetical protein BXU09_11475 [Deinococcus sp. LM3]|nr:hypothetical protein BXU09_11475 [Deinococcus sp. LM3]